MKLKAIFLMLALCFLMIDVSISEERQGLVNIKVNLNSPEITQSAKIWIPYPLSDNYQLIENIVLVKSNRTFFLENFHS